MNEPSAAGERAERRQSPPSPFETRLARVTSAIVLGLESLLGRPGIGVAALLVVLLGNPLSGLASAPEMLPTPWGAIGQLLPPGGTGTLLRNVAFFDGAAIATPILVLLGWLALGVALLAIAGLRARRAPAGERAAVVGVDGPA